MPTIEVAISDLESLLEETLSRERLETLLEKVKGEVKDFSPETGMAKIELNDTNRPDLWSPEGIVRQLRPPKKPWRQAYPFFDGATQATHRVDISKDVAAVRPYLAACISRGMTVTPAILDQLIQTQEKLAESFGRKRQTVSIGLYRLPLIKFPVQYTLADPESTRFIPLGFESPMSLNEILSAHPKGLEYAGTLAGADRYPILKDAKGEILSFPPIINSQSIGEVAVGDSELFVEVTGTDLRMVVLAINIFAANLADRGASIEAIALNYPEATAFGARFQTPYDLSEALDLDLATLNRVLGERVEMEEACRVLEAYGLTTLPEGQHLKVSVPPYRDDIMHPIDLVEDFAISRGLASFVPEMPATFTVGALSKIEQFSDALRDALIGYGFEEVVSNILGSSEDLLGKMRLQANQGDHAESAETRIVVIENPMTERFSLLRSWLLPSLLRVEGASSKAYYPHRIFEVGEIAQRAPETATLKNGASTRAQTRTSLRLGALIAHPHANFSELHAVLEALFFRLSVNYRLAPKAYPSLIDGRAGQILAQDRELGWIGEVHPEVLDAWQIGMPTVAFEINIEKI